MNQITFSTYKNEDISIQLFKYLFDNQMWEQSYGTSMSLSLYKNIIETNSIDTDKFTVIIARNNNIPIGVSILESYEPIRYQLQTLQNSTIISQNPTVKFKIDKNFLNAGWLQFYIKPEYRKKGIATELLLKIEQEYISKITPILNENDLPMVLGMGNAFDLILNKSIYTHPIRSNKKYTNFIYDIDSLSRSYISDVINIKNGDTPLKKLLNKELENFIIIPEKTNKFKK